jgi:hypothetical protein
VTWLRRHFPVYSARIRFVFISVFLLFFESSNVLRRFYHTDLRCFRFNKLILLFFCCLSRLNLDRHFLPNLRKYRMKEPSLVLYRPGIVAQLEGEIERLFELRTLGLTVKGPQCVNLARRLMASSEYRTMLVTVGGRQDLNSWKVNPKN